MTIGNEWDDVLSDASNSEKFTSLQSFIECEKIAGKSIYPSSDNVLKAFQLTPFSEVKIVILGQDPYHGEGQAHGLAFSVPRGIKLPPSLRNIYKEIARDFDTDIPESGNLEPWAQQGVLLLNTALTVEAGLANSHSGKGWEEFTDAAISALSKKRNALVFVLWGKHAQKKKRLVDETKHHVLEAPHPSPLSAHRGFIGCGHFSTANQLLIDSGVQPIDWLNS